MLGTLIINPKEAKVTKDTRIFGSMSPYCLIKYKDFIARTSIKDGGGKTPKWNDSLIIRAELGEKIEIKVIDFESTTKDTLLGETTLEVKKFKKEALKINLQLDGKNSGEISLEFEYIDDLPYELRKNSKGEDVFIDLKSVFLEEKKKKRCNWKES